jgi:NCS1 family nucleobase:cation symporter-1
MSWLLGFAISGSVWILLNAIWPPPGLGEVDEKDVFGTFGEVDTEINSTEGDYNTKSKDSG